MGFPKNAKEPEPLRLRFSLAYIVRKEVKVSLTP